MDSSRTLPRADSVVAWLAGLVAVLCVVQPAYFPTVDGPQHLYAAYILKHRHELSAWYEASVPISASGAYLVLMPLTLVLPWALAYRVALGVFVGVWCAGTAALARSLDPARSWVAVAMAALGLQWSLYMGLFSFVLATGLGFWALAIAIRGPRRPWVLPVLLSLVVLGHMFVGLLMVSTILVVRQADCPGEERGRRLVLDALPLLLCGVQIALITVPPSAGSTWLTPPLTDQLQAVGKMMAGGPWWRCALPALGALVGIGLAGWRGSRTERALGLVALGALVVGVLAPMHMPGWMYLSPRFLPLGTVLGLALLPVERLAGVGATVMRAAIALWTVAALGWSVSFHRDLATQLGPTLALLDAPVRRTGARLPIVSRDPWFEHLDSLDRPYPYFDPLYNLALLATENQGGVAVYTFTQWPLLHPFLSRPGAFPPLPPRETFWVGLVDPEVRTKGTLRQALLTDLASRGTPYEDVILLGDEEDQALLRGRGYETAWQSRDAWIGSFRGCPAQLTLQVPEGAPGRWSVSFGWLPLRAPAWQGEATREPGASTVQVTLPRTPCGPMWVAVTPADGEAAAWRCQGSNDEGRMLFPGRKQKASFVCPIVDVRQGAPSPSAPPGAQSP